MVFEVNKIVIENEQGFVGGRRVQSLISMLVIILISVSTCLCVTVSVYLSVTVSTCFCHSVTVYMSLCPCVSV